MYAALMTSRVLRLSTFLGAPVTPPRAQVSSYIPPWHQHLLRPGARLFWVFSRLASHQSGLCSRDISPERGLARPCHLRRSPFPLPLTSLCVLPYFIYISYFSCSLSLTLLPSWAGYTPPQHRWKTLGDLKETGMTVPTCPSAAGGCLSLPLLITPWESRQPLQMALGTWTRETYL